MCFKQYIHKDEYTSLYETNTTINMENIIDISIGKKLNDSQTFNVNYDFNHHLNEETAIEIYTDGSKNPNQKSVGSACYCPQFLIEKSLTESLPKIASIFTSECFAVSMALDIVLENPQTKFNIYTDSLSCCTSLINAFSTNSINPYIKQIHAKLQKIQNYHQQNVKIIWIPGHRGIKRNEKVDLIAKLATNNSPSNILLPFTDITTVIKEKYRKESLNNNLAEVREKGCNYYNFSYHTNS